MISRLIPLLMVFLLLGCQPDGREVIKLGVSPWPGYEFLFLAQELGLFHQAGVAVRLVEFSSLGDSRRAYEQGLVDGIATTMVEVVQIKNFSNRQPKVVMVMDFSNGGDVILARQPYSSLQQLAGRRIGVEHASVGIYLLYRALERVGMTIDQVQLVLSNPMSLEQEMAQGKLDAMVTYPPYATTLLRNKEIKTIFNSGEIPNEVVDVLVFDDTLLRKQRHQVEKLVEVWDNALEWYGNNPSDAITIMAGREKVSPEEFQNCMSQLRMLTRKDQQSFFVPGGHLHQVFINILRVINKEYFSYPPLSTFSSEIIQDNLFLNLQEVGP